MLRQADVVFVHDGAGNGREARQANAQEGGLVLVKHHRLAGRPPILLAVLRRHEAAARGMDQVRAARQVDELEHTVGIGARRRGGAGAAGHRLYGDQGARQRLPGLVFHHRPFDDGGLKRAAREQEQQRLAHGFCWYDAPCPQRVETKWDRIVGRHGTSARTPTWQPERPLHGCRCSSLMSWDELERNPAPAAFHLRHGSSAGNSLQAFAVQSSRRRPMPGTDGALL